MRLVLKMALQIHLFWAGPLRSHEATPDRAALRTNLRDLQSR
jgi:hypothetical protein